MHNQIIAVVINNERTLMELTEEQEATLEEHLARYRQSTPPQTVMTEEQKAKLEDLQRRYRQLTPEQIALLRNSSAEVSSELKRIQRAAVLETALKAEARANPNFVHSFELFPEDMIRQRIWSATAEVSPQLKTTDQVRPQCKPNFVITCWHCAKQVNTTDKGLRYCSEECRTRNPINLDLFDTFNLENA